MFYLLLTCLMIFIPTVHCDESSLDKYDALGGWKKISSEPKRFFYVEEIDGIWWLINPAGNAFISKGVNHISYMADFAPELGYNPYGRNNQQKYGTAANWAEKAAKNLRQWNFNTVGSWPDKIMRRQEIPYTLILNIASKAGGNWQRGVFPDVYSKKFKRAARNTALTECRKLKNDIFLIGYFTDNELHWGPDWRTKNSLLIDYLLLDKDAPGRSQAVSFLKQKYKDINEFNQAWNVEAITFNGYVPSPPMPASQNRKKDETEFQRIVSAEYFRICHQEIKREDPNHLILGCRFAGKAPETVLESAGKYCDIITFNTYNFEPPKNTLKRIYQLTQRPVMVTEFSFKAMDSGLPNTKGAGRPVKTQADRAKHFTSFVKDLMKLPFMIGYHWFEYADEPKEGRFDGENSNYGLVNIKDKPYEILTQEMTKTNNIIEKCHLRAK